jgi:hypothetical protein
MKLKQSEDTKHLHGFLKPDRNPTKKCRKLKHLVLLKTTLNREGGRKQKTKQKRIRKPGVEKTKSFVWINARKKTVNSLSGKGLTKCSLRILTQELVDNF